MIDYKSFTLKNGLKVMVYQDPTTPLCAFNLMYNVGARDEDESQTGFAHLFEHLMFGGSENIANYDVIAQEIGAMNNAFTSNDITNYYLTFPAGNLETVFWLESDRMNKLDFSEKSLTVQRNVVIEEFKQRYLNQPYGDIWLKLRPLAYKKHPYKWATIGKEIKHIEDAQLQDVERFFYKFYRPNNAYLSIAGNVNYEEVEALAHKYFGEINAGEIPSKHFEKEPVQLEPRKETVEAHVPASAIYKAWHMSAFGEVDYYGTDLISNILGDGQSSRLHQILVKETRLMSNATAFIMGSIDNGLLVFSGHLTDNATFDQIDNIVAQEIQKLKETPLSLTEITKLRNQAESYFEFSEASILNVAMKISFCELLGRPELVNGESKLYENVQPADIQRIATQVLNENNCSTLYYKAIK